VTTNNKDFVVKQGIKVATGVTFPDGTVQQTAYLGGSLDGGTPTSSFLFTIDGGTPSDTF
jgi:hypothetical protein